MSLKLAWGMAGILCTLGAMYLIVHDEWVLAVMPLIGGIISLIHLEQA